MSAPGKHNCGNIIPDIGRYTCVVEQVYRSTTNLKGVQAQQSDRHLAQGQGNGDRDRDRDGVIIRNPRNGIKAVA